MKNAGSVLYIKRFFFLVITVVKLSVYSIFTWKMECLNMVAATCIAPPDKRLQKNRKVNDEAAMSVCIAWFA